MKSIGIDIGTTTISVVVLDGNTREIARKYTVKNDSFLPARHPWERIQDVQRILEKTMSVLEELLDFFDDVISIGLTGQMHGILYVDQKGEAVSPLYTWQDESGNQPEFCGKSICELLAESDEVHVAAGYGTVTYLYHSKKGLVPKDAVSFCTIADYLGMALTGRRAPLIHISQAAGMGLYDQERREFLRTVLEKNGADPSLLPCITDEITALGTFRGIPVSVSLGDNQASFLGCVGDRENTLLINVGTGAQVSVLSDHYCRRDGIEARPLKKDSWLLVGATLCGGAAFAALEQFFREYAAAAGAPDVPQFEIMKSLLMRQTDPTEAWKVKTTFAGTRENPRETGSVSGITRANFHPAAFIRGVLNGMSQELYDLYLSLKKEVAISKIMASGNGIRKNEMLRQILSERFGMPLEIIQTEEEAAVGAAMASLEIA